MASAVSGGHRGIIALPPALHLAKEAFVTNRGVRRASWAVLVSEDERGGNVVQSFYVVLFDLSLFLKPVLKTSESKLRRPL